MGGSVPDLSQVGVKADSYMVENSRREVARLLGRENSNFPGAQPISFARKHLAELKSRDYYVCEKSDGIRCLLYFTTDDSGLESHALIDRKNDYYWIKDEFLHLPLPPPAPTPEEKNPPIDWASWHVDTLLDGELLYDTEPDGQRTLKYLVFDSLVIDGQNLMGRPLDKRLAYFIDKIHKPYRALCKMFPDDAQAFVFTIEQKKFEFGYGTEVLFRDTIPKLKHGSDGLVFTCKETPYTFGTDEHILKWKPAEENTIDFRLSMEYPPLDPNSNESTDEALWDRDYNAMPKFTLFVHQGREGDTPDDILYATEAEWTTMKQYAIDHNDGLEGQIIECHKDKEGRWRFNRFRDDKTEANHVSTVRKVKESIEDAVSQAELIAAAPEIRNKWKQRQALAEQKIRMEKQQQQQRETAEQRRQDLKRKTDEG